MVLDQATLFTVATGITGLLGVFLLVLWLQERSVRALGWWGAAYLMGASAVTLWGTHDALWLRHAGNAERAAVHRLRHDLERRAAVSRPHASCPVRCSPAPWPGSPPCSTPEFAHSEHARVVLSSLVIALYAFLTAFELRRERRRDLAARTGSRSRFRCCTARCSWRRSR